MSARPSQAVTTAAKWHRFAACRQVSSLDFVEAAPGTAEAMACKAICRCCPVRLTCATTALYSAEPWGVWGALDADERTRLAQQSAA